MVAARWNSLEQILQRIFSDQYSLDENRVRSKFIIIDKNKDGAGKRLEEKDFLPILFSVDYISRLMHSSALLAPCTCYLRSVEPAAWIWCRMETAPV